MPVTFSVKKKIHTTSIYLLNKVCLMHRISMLIRELFHFYNNPKYLNKSYKLCFEISFSLLKQSQISSSVFASVLATPLRATTYAFMREKSSNSPLTWSSYSLLPYLSSYKTGFCPSTMTSNNLISPMKFRNNTNFTLPKQSQRSRSVLQDGSRSLGWFWKKKNSIL